MKLVQRRWPDIERAFWAGKMIVGTFGGRIVTVLPEPTEMNKQMLVVWFEVPNEQDIVALDEVIKGF